MIARIASPIYTLGPGARTVIWFSGCHRRCPLCANPELWAFDHSLDLSVEEVAELIVAAHDGGIDGFTITGGEPFDQPEGLAALLAFLRGISEDILVYTGYTLAELKATENRAVFDALSGVAVLIDGPYRDEENNGLPLRGSGNQQVHVFDKRYDERYRAALSPDGARIQNLPVTGGYYSVGIHQKGFRQTLNEGLRGFGLEES
jgi:anaerobic ribonucleoside-triphosphate reductase activating protein